VPGGRCTKEESCLTRPQGRPIEVDALAGAITRNVLRAAAETVVLTVDWLEQQRRELNQLQKIELVRTALLSFQGIEEDVKDAIQREVDLASRFVPKVEAA
jgi:hypothetical protein